MTSSFEQVTKFIILSVCCDLDIGPISPKVELD